MKTLDYSAVGAKLAEVWDEVENSREEVLLQRRGHEDMVLIPARELESLKRTVHLLRSPQNTVRLMAALARSRNDGGEEYTSVQTLAAAVGLDE